MLSRRTAAAAARCMRPLGSRSTVRALASSSTSRLPRQLPGSSYEQRLRSSAAEQSNVTEELSGTDPAIPWFLQSETVEAPTQVPETSSSADEIHNRFSYIPQTSSQHIPHTIARLQDHLVTGPSANLIARPESDAAPQEGEGEEVTPITLIHPASLTKDPSGDMYSANDWIMIVQVRSSAAGSVRRVAIDIGKFLKHARPPAMGPEELQAEDFLGPPPSTLPHEKKEVAPPLAPRPKGVSRIEHEFGKSLPSWAVNRIALQRKFPEGWRPPKVLSREAQEGMRLLHTTNPEEFGIEQLSSRFRISAESVRRILKGGKWNVTGEARSRQDRRAAEYAHRNESSELAELRKMEQHNNELAADNESPQIEPELAVEDADLTEAEIAAQEAEIREEEATPGLVPVRYEGLVMTASDAAATNTTAKSKTNAKRGDGNWCLIDAEWCVVHVMTAQARYNYDIEGMWREFQVSSHQERGSTPNESLSSIVAAPPLKARSRARRDVLGEDISRKNKMADAERRQAKLSNADNDTRFGDISKSKLTAARGSTFRRGFATSAVSKSIPHDPPFPETLNQLLSRVQHSSPTEFSALPVTVKAWIRSTRRQKSITFLEVSDGSLNGSRTLQAVLRTSSQQGSSITFQPDQLLGLTVGTAVELTGHLRSGKGSKVGQNIELDVSALRILSACDPTYPLTAVTMQQHGISTAAPNTAEERQSSAYSASLAERRSPHLQGRLPRYAALMRTRDRIEQGMAAYLSQHEFVKIACPIITSTDCEGAGEVFQLGADSDIQSGAPMSSFWGAAPAYLTVSSQLHLEAVGLGLARVWTLNPAFRAEGSATSRHLAEFWMLEAEMYFTQLQGAMDLAEGVIRAAIRAALHHGAEDMQLLTHGNSAHMDTLQSVLQSDRWARVTFHQAHEILRDAHAQHAFTIPPDPETGLASEHEKYLAEIVFQAPVFVTHYPRVQKAFYMNPVDETSDLVECFDLLIPGVGELVGGSARQTTATTAMGEKLHWYTQDLKKFGGAVPHAGFGLGLERLTAYITHTENVRDVVPFPRTKGRVRF